MSDLTVKFRARNYNNEILLPHVDLKVQRYVNAAMGGPKQAVIKVYGDDIALWQLVTLIRCPLKIFAPEGDAVWWGLAADISGVLKNPGRPQDGFVRIGLSLDTMYNRVMVAYTLIDVTGNASFTRANTAWADDSPSQTEYGIKELLWTKTNATATHAEAARDMKLRQTAYPILTRVSTPDESQSYLELVCRGWGDTLAWLYYGNSGTDAVDTATQVYDMLTAKGQFFSTIYQDVMSGITVNEYRDGDTDALTEALKLLEMGTTNFRRMLYKVDEHRNVRIYEQPAQPYYTYQIDARGNIYDDLGNPIRKAICPAGVWARDREIVPHAVDTSYIGGTNAYFIETMEYDMESDRLQHRALGAPDPWEFPKAKDG